MANSEAYIREKLKEKESALPTGLSISPGISQKVAINAASKICGGINPANIIAVIDTTVFGSGKEGCAFTGTDLYIREVLAKPRQVPFNGLVSASYDVVETKNGDTVSKNYVLSFTYDDDRVIRFESLSKTEHYPILAEIMNDLNGQVEEIEINNQTAKLEDMGDEIIGLYLMIVTAYLKSDAGIIDPGEYKELMSLMARTKVSKALAEDLRESRLSVDVKLDYRDLIDRLDAALARDKIDPTNIHQSLFFDLLGTRDAAEEIWKKDAVLNDIKEQLGISDKAAEFGLRNLQQSKTLIESRMTDSQFKDAAKELGALAGGAGVAIGALAITGGGSLASGLFTLALASTGGMLLGLAAIGGIGYGAYKGIKYFSGTSELEKSGIRVEALRRALENNKATTTYIIEDINELNGKIQEILNEMSASNDLDAEIDALLNLSGFVNNVSNSAMSICQDSDKKNYEIHIAKLPLLLPKSRYAELVKKDINQVDINDFVYSVYKETVEVDNSNPDMPIEKTVYKRDEELDYDVAEKLYTIFESIGLYDTKAAATATATASIDKAASFIKGFFN